MSSPDKNVRSFFHFDSLQEAWLKVKRKKARGGIDGVTVARFEKNAETYLRELTAGLAEDRYVPEPYERVYRKQIGGADRPLGLPTVKDKVVQMAVRDVLEPVFNPLFLDCSYAYRPGKGHRKAIRRVEHYLKTGNVWVTTCDIDRFFDSLNHALLLQRIEEKITDPKIIRLITLWLKIGIVHRREYRETDKGVPQGGIISPLLSNIYLHPFDQYLRDKKFNLVRYADDFIILARRKNEARKGHDLAKDYLANRLKLNLNPEDKVVCHVKSGFVFLGMEFRGYRRIISEKKFIKARSKIKNIIRNGRKNKLAGVVDDLNETIRSWRYYYGKGDTQPQFRRLEQIIQNELIDLLRIKIDAGEYAAGKDAKEILLKLDFLLPRKTTDRRRFVNSIIKGKKIAAEFSFESGRQEEEKPSAEKKKPESGKSGDIRSDIYHKKKKYQRQYAATSDLIISRFGLQLGKMYRRIVVRGEGKIIRQIPANQLKYIMIISRGVSLSSDVIRLCGQANIPIDFIDWGGQPSVRLANPLFPRLDVGLAQLEAFGNGKAQILAVTFVAAKVRNQMNLMKYFHKYRRDADKSFHKKFVAEEKRMTGYMKELENIDDDRSLTENRKKLLAIEGRTASSYWELIREMVKDEVDFKKRVHQGAADLFNCLLNYGYGILYSRIWGSVLRAGLNPAISFLHTEQPNKPTLVFDLIEEFRSQAVDRVIITMLNRGETLNMKGDFLDSATRRKLAQNITERLNTPIKFRKREMTLANIINHQGKSLAAYLLGKINGYKPYIGKW